MGKGDPDQKKPLENVPPVDTENLEQEMDRQLVAQEYRSSRNQILWAENADDPEEEDKASNAVLKGRSFCSTKPKLQRNYRLLRRL
ncbi:MAG: hypothetical protein LQ346_002083 [Caloplaca aetnensis]|nr:MAG: hypothetical protein LQ346_002083 [Caloplaca aetnensis]